MNSFRLLINNWQNYSICTRWSTADGKSALDIMSIVNPLCLSMVNLENSKMAGIAKNLTGSENPLGSASAYNKNSVVYWQFKAS